MNRQEIFRHVKRATVAVAMVDARNSQQPFQIVGSGFCVDPEGLVVTCRHVADAFMSKPTKEQIVGIPENEKSKPIQQCSPVEHITSYAVFYTLEADAVRVDCIQGAGPAREDGHHGDLESVGNSYSSGSGQTGATRICPPSRYSFFRHEGCVRVHAWVLRDHTSPSRDGQRGLRLSQ
jgi:hypothetical protein